MAPSISPPATEVVGRRMLRTVIGAAVAMVAAVVLCGAASDTNIPVAVVNPNVPLWLQAEPGMLKSSRGDVWVIGTDRPTTMVLLRWVDDVLARLDRLVGRPSLSPEQKLRIVIKTGEPPAVAGMQHVEQGQLVQTLFVRNHDELDREVIDAALCHLVIEGWVVEAARQDHEVSSEWIEEGAAAAVPDWLATGLSANLYSARRARNSRNLLNDWQTAAAPRVLDFLALETTGAATNTMTHTYDARAFEGILVEWLLDQPDRHRVVDRLLERMADEKSLDPEWFLSLIEGAASHIDLDAMWDARVLSRKRNIYAIGTATRADLAQFKSALILEPGVDGLPLMENQRGLSTLADLVAHRKADWMRAYASNKSVSLRTLALGKPKFFQDAVGRYCVYLDALAKRRRAGRLKALLDEADAGLVQLEAELADAERLTR